MSGRAACRAIGTISKNASTISTFFSSDFDDVSRMTTFCGTISLYTFVSP